MINLELLDKEKTYCIYEIGTGIISRLIQKVSLPDNIKEIPTNRIATHVAVLLFNKEWVVYESHAKTSGVHKEPYLSWINEVAIENIFCFPFYANKQILEYYVDFNPGYSLADITRFSFTDLIKKIRPEHIFNDNPGVVCSEYIAKCNIDRYGKVGCIVNIFDLPAYEVMPIHFQMLDNEEQYAIS